MDIPLCLEGIVGVSSKDCDCYLDGRPAGYNAALSHLYLDDKIDMKLTDKAPCGSGTMWDIGISAIQRATREYMTAQFRCWAQDNDPIPPKRFHVGERTFTGPFAPGRAWAGVRIRPHQHIEHGEMIVHGIDTAFTTGGTDTILVKCWNSVSDTVLWQTTLDTSAGQLHQNVLAPSQKMPFVIPYTSDARYYIVYEVGSMVPMNSDCFCSCNTKQIQLEEWAIIDGIAGDDPSDRKNWTPSFLNNGLFLDITMNCDTRKSICVETMDFNTDALAMQKAEAIYYRALAIVAEDILKRADHSGYTAWDTERLVSMRNLWSQEHQVRMNTLCAKAPPGSCYKCPEGGFRMVSLAD